MFGPYALVASFVFFVSFVLFVAFMVADRALAQADPADADLVAASGGRAVQVRSVAAGALAAIPLELYVARVLAGEGEPRAADAAQQALAVAIRTFALANEGRHRREGYDLCDTTHCQVLRAATAATRRAAMLTAGRILTYNGRPAELFYSASCGGRTESAAAMWPRADLPYLQTMDDDVHGGEEPWTVAFPLRTIEAALARAGVEGERLRHIEVEERSQSGRVTRIRLDGLRPGVMTGDQFRLAIGARELRSTAFELDVRGQVARFTGRGYGHGVGLCVIGAGRRAARGETVEAILGKYFPGLALTPRRPIATEVAVPPAPSVLLAPPALSPSLAPSAPSALDAVAARAHAELSKTLGTSVAPVTVLMYDSIERFRLATGRPWWVGVVADGTSIELAPAPILAQRDGVDAAIRQGVAELLVTGALAGRPAWVRIGAARYFAHGGIATPAASGRCPADAELTLAISAAAQRDAEARAEACFARALQRVSSWRDVK